MKFLCCLDMSSLLDEFTLRSASKRLQFGVGRKDVTILAYYFRDADSYESQFLHLQGALIETWKHCGMMKTVIVSNRAGPALLNFAHEFNAVEIQTDPSLVPGDIDSMSRDCNSRLYTRFSTPYVLIVQDDGFPLRAGLDEFLRAKYDFYGAPFCRNKMLPRLLTRICRFAPMNGGFSLRSHRCCQIVAEYWHRYYADLPFRSEFCEDNFYTNYLPKHHLTALLKLRPCPCDIAYDFSYDAGFLWDEKRSLPFGFHNRKAFEIIAKSYGFRGNLC